MLPAEFWIIRQWLCDLLVGSSICWWFVPCTFVQRYWSPLLSLPYCCNYSSIAYSYLFLLAYFYSLRIGSWISGIIPSLRVISWAFIILDANILFDCYFGFGSFKNCGSTHLDLIAKFLNGCEISSTISSDFGCLSTVLIAFLKSSHCVSYFITHIGLLSSLNFVLYSIVLCY